MKWHWLRYKEVLEKLRIYWDIGKNNDAYYFTKHHPLIHHHQMLPSYIHTSNLLRKIHHTIRFCEVVLDQVPFTQSCMYSLKTIQFEPQSMTDKFHTFRKLNCTRKKNIAH